MHGEDAVIRNSFLVKPDLQSLWRTLSLSSSFAGWVTAQYPGVIIKGTGIKQKKMILLYGIHLALNGLMFPVFLAGFNICARRKPHFSLSCSCSPSKWLLPASHPGSRPLQKPLSRAAALRTPSLGSGSNVQTLPRGRRGAAGRPPHGRADRA